MDKGLDIEAAFHVAVLHAALNSRPARLAESLISLLQLHAAAAPPARLAQCVRRALSSQALSPDWAAGERLVSWLAGPHRRQLVLGEADYPARLAAIPDPPPVLLLEGLNSALAAPQLAVVGSRRATLAAREFARELAAGLTAAGLAITSGLATGVDGAAHAGALDAGGLTLAVFGCGPDRIYPRAHAELAARIRDHGLLVSEFALGTPPLPAHFPRRNRIISGLCLGTVVIEAALTSGSLVTARQALDQGREVFAVPGSVRNPLSRGCHALIRDGATLVEQVSDVLDALPGFLPRHVPTPCSERDRARDSSQMTLLSGERSVFDACDFEPRGIDCIVAESGLTAPEVSSILTALEMKGVVRAVGGGVYVRTGKIPA